MLNLFPALVFLIALAILVSKLCAFLTAAKDRAGAWYMIAAWAQANGDAAMLRTSRRRNYARLVAQRAGFLDAKVANSE